MDRTKWEVAGIICQPQTDWMQQLNAAGQEGWEPWYMMPPVPAVDPVTGQQVPGAFTFQFLVKRPASPILDVNGMPSNGGRPNITRLK